MTKINYAVKVIQNPMYNRWSKLKHRTMQQGRFLAACWRDDYLQFLADVGEPPVPGARLGMINPQQGYRPGNVRWMQPARPTAPPKHWASPKQPAKSPVLTFNWAGWVLIFKKGSID